MVPSTAKPVIFCVAPNTRSWTVTEPRAGSTNCGRKATMNSAVFGLRTLTTMPCQKIFRSGAPSGATASASMRRISVRTPSTIRYAAPA